MNHHRAAWAFGIGSAILFFGGAAVSVAAAVAVSPVLALLALMCYRKHLIEIGEY